MLITVCAYCGKVIKTEKVNIEDSVEKSQVSHGICKSCYKPVMVEIDNMIKISSVGK